MLVGQYVGIGVDVKEPVYTVLVDSVVLDCTVSQTRLGQVDGGDLTQSQSRRRRRC